MLRAVLMGWEAAGRATIQKLGREKGVTLVKKECREEGGASGEIK